MKTLIQQAGCCLTALRCAANERLARRKSVGETETGMLVLPPGGVGYRQAGLSKIALTLIITGVSVGIAVAVFALLGPKIMELARGIGVAIDNVDTTGASWGE
jgi:hypothetical protein